MDIDSIEKPITPTPRTIYLICVWVLFHAIIPLSKLIGQYNINNAFLVQSDASSSGSRSFFEWLFTSNDLGIATVLISLAFIISGIGIVTGKNWGRLGFLIISVTVLILSLITVTQGRYSIPLYSLVALGFAYWYFRQPEILHFFGAKDNSPSFLNRKILNAPLDLGISLGIFIILIILEIIGLLQLV